MSQAVSDTWWLDRRAPGAKSDPGCDDWSAGGRAKRPRPAGSPGQARGAKADADCDDCAPERADIWPAVAGPGAHDPLADIADPVRGGTDWQLLRKFATFWPADEPAPPAFLWLGTLVSRRKAWRWVSRFPRHFADVHPDDHGMILDFIGRTLTDVEPSASEDGEKKCCKKKEPEPGPLPPTDDDLPENTSCEPESYFVCFDCPPGMGQLVEKMPVGDDCLTVRHGFCVPTDRCPGSGPIEPDPAF